MDGQNVEFCKAVSCTVGREKISFSFCLNNYVNLAIYFNILTGPSGSIYKLGAWWCEVIYSIQLKYVYTSFSI